MIRALLDAVVLDVGGTLVAEAPPATAVASLRAEPLPGVVDGLARLAATGVRLGAATNTSVMREPEVRALLGPCGIDEWLEVVVTSCDVAAAKPDPACINEVLRRMRLDDPTRVLYVGDRDTDEEAARRAGVHYAPIEPEGLGPTITGWLHGWAGTRWRAAAAAVAAPDEAARAEALELHTRLTKPVGSLGRLEHLGAHLAAMAGACPPPAPVPAAVTVFAGDHGVVASGVSRWPQEVTAQMVANFVAGGAAINVLAGVAGARVRVVDVAVATPLPEAVRERATLLRRTVRDGTADLATEPAMTRAEAEAALDVGAELAEHCVDEGARCLVTGDMGIGNTTPSAALIAVFTGRPARDVTGLGAGLEADQLAKKISIIERAVARVDGDDAVGVLAQVGGCEIAALAGYAIGAAARRVPLVADGVIALAGVLVAERLVPGVREWVIAGHRSTEPGASVVLAELGLEPLLDLGLRLGEGSGAALALPLIHAAAKVLSDMATFDAAGVSAKTDG